MVIVGFVTYTWEALLFVNDPFNVSKEDSKVYLKLSKTLYVVICLLMISYLLYCLIQIIVNYNEISFRQKIFFLFSIYFIFTINLCLFISHRFWQHLYIFPKWRKGTPGHNHQQPLRVYAPTLLHAESTKHQR